MRKVAKLFVLSDYKMAKNPKLIIEKEASKLIQTITGFDSDEENFELCEKFVLSNIFYHKYLDPDEIKIDREIKGIVQKFRIHAQPEKANAFEKLIEKYKNDEVFSESHEQFDIKYRLLSLLLNLSETPVNIDYEIRDSSPEEQSEQVSMDWF